MAQAPEALPGLPDVSAAASAGSAWDPATMTLPWVESPFFPSLLAASELAPAPRELARHYAEQGYVVIDTGIPDDLIRGVVDGLGGTYREGVHAYDSRVQDAPHEAVRRVAASPTVLDLLRLFYRREPIPFQTLNFERGTQQRAHSDAIHFHSIPHRFMCGVWMALEDTDDSNGPLFVHPRSHRLPVYELRDLGLPVDAASYPQYEAFVEALMATQGLPRRELHLRRGQALVWAANLHHGGSRVLDPGRTRLSQVTHYFFADCLYYSPMGSDPVRGRIQLRRVTDLRTGAVVPHVHEGRALEPSGTATDSRRSRGPSALQGLVRPWRLFGRRRGAGSSPR